MIEEMAKVVAVDEGVAWVETQRNSACGGCAANKGCGTATLGKVLGNRPSRVRALTRVSVRPGDAVVVGLAEHALIKGSLAVYAVPLLLMFVFALSGHILAGAWHVPYSEGWRIMAALAGLATGFWWVGRFSARIHGDERYQAVILRKADVTRTAVPVLNLSGSPDS